MKNSSKSHEKLFQFLLYMLPVIFPWRLFGVHSGVLASLSKWVCEQVLFDGDYFAVFVRPTPTCLSISTLHATGRVPVPPGFIPFFFLCTFASFTSITRFILSNKNLLYISPYHASFGLEIQIGSGSTNPALRNPTRITVRTAGILRHIDTIKVERFPLSVSVPSQELFCLQHTGKRAGAVFVQAKQKKKTDLKAHPKRWIFANSSSTLHA